MRHVSLIKYRIELARNQVSVSVPVVSIIMVSYRPSLSDSAMKVLYDTGGTCTSCEDCAAVLTRESVDSVGMSGSR